MSHPKANGESKTYHLTRTRFDTCIECGIPADTPVHIHKTTPGKWTDDTDLAETWPGEWTQRTAYHRIRATGLCDRCHALKQPIAKALECKAYRDRKAQGETKPNGRPRLEAPSKAALQRRAQRERKREAA